MSLVLELPEPLNQELSGEASREDVSLSDRASLLLCIVAAFHDLGKAATPFQHAIKVFSEAHRVDPHGLALLVDHLLESCQAPMGKGKTEMLLSYLANSSGKNLETEPELFLVLQNWKQGFVHEPINVSPRVILTSLEPVKSFQQGTGRLNSKPSEPTDEESTENRDDQWPEGFFETTYGSLSENHIERLPQGQYDIRDEIE